MRKTIWISNSNYYCRTINLKVCCVWGPISYLCYLCLFGYSARGVQYVLTKWVTWRISYKKQELLTIREHLSSPLVFGNVRIADLLLVFCAVFVCMFVCLRHVSCVPNVVSVSRLSIPACLFGFL